LSKAICIAFDERRHRKLTRLGNRVPHLDAALVMQQPSLAVERIREAIAVAQSREQHLTQCGTATAPFRDLHHDDSAS
jgi:hypothetical protein